MSTRYQPSAWSAWSDHAHEQGLRANGGQRHGTCRYERPWFPAATPFWRHTLYNWYPFILTQACCAQVVLGFGSPEVFLTLTHEPYDSENLSWTKNWNLTEHPRCRKGISLVMQVCTSWIDWGLMVKFPAFSFTGCDLRHGANQGRSGSETQLASTSKSVTASDTFCRS